MICPILILLIKNPSQAPRPLINKAHVFKYKGKIITGGEGKISHPNILPPITAPRTSPNIPFTITQL
jgi:hypothetical protein